MCINCASLRFSAIAACACCSFNAFGASIPGYCRNCLLRWLPSCGGLRGPGGLSVEKWVTRFSCCGTPSQISLRFDDRLQL
ncbi:hypothetical protein CCR75_006673 [Bremia lactucae]|uniref:Secreted protein n=1 Tax=Bremia lactucae TaxID=4779 RepID=A0A976IJF7_BRELC|nr:hypothetical protein CCR75_006673 [Bremia lactucae]